MLDEYNRRKKISKKTEELQKQEENEGDIT